MLEFSVMLGFFSLAFHICCNERVIHADNRPVTSNENSPCGIHFECWGFLIISGKSSINTFSFAF